MGLRDKLTQTAKSAAVNAAGSARDATVNHAVSKRLAALLEMDDDRPMTVESLTTTLVSAVRDDEDDELTARDVKKAAKRRQRLLGMAGALGGPVGIYISSLYCEVVIVCDVEEMHRLELSDSQVAAHVLVLWNVMPDYERALAAVEGTGQSVAARSLELLGDAVAPLVEEPLKKRQAVKLAWRLRGTVGDATDAAPGSARARDVIFPASRVKELIAAAEEQLRSAEPGHGARARPVDPDRGLGA